MSTSFEILGLIIGLLNYAFVLLFLFNLLKVDYYNPIVSIVVKAYKPVSKFVLSISKAFKMCVEAYAPTY